MLKLNNDVRAKAGEFLVLHENGNVYVVDEGSLEEAICGPASGPKQGISLADKVAGKASKKKRRTPSTSNDIESLLLSGLSLDEVARRTNVAHWIVDFRRKKMVEEGLLPPLTKKTPVKHHWYKSAEALEAARERARHAWRVRMAKFAKKETGK
jgi:hypothetical protein